MDEYKYELYHYGVKGMKWGVIRKRVRTGVRKAKKKFNKALEDQKAKIAAKKKQSRSITELSDQELKEKINRLNLERQALDLERQVSALKPEHISFGEKLVKNVGGKVIGPAMADAGKRVLTDFLNKKGREMLGLDKNDPDPIDALKKEVFNLNLKKQHNELKKYFDNEDKKSQDDNPSDKKDSQSTSSKKETSSASDSEPKKEAIDLGDYVNTSNSKSTFQTSNAKGKSVSEVYKEMYPEGKSAVEKLYSSGFMMTPVSTLSGTAPRTNGRISNNSSYLSGVGDWKMSSLEKLEGK